MDSPPYRYRRLTDETAFRVVVILPGSADDELLCEIKQHFFELYDAVSWICDNEVPSRETLIGVEDDNLRYVFRFADKVNGLIRGTAILVQS